MQPAAQVPGVYHRRLGNLLVSAVSDGYVDPPGGTVRGIDEGGADRMALAANGRPGLRIGVTMFAIRGAGRTVFAGPASRRRTSTPSC